MTQTAQQQGALRRELSVDSQVVTNAYDLPPEREIVPHSDRNSILWVGSSDPDQKKPQRFLELAAAIPDESFQIVSKRMPDDDGYHEQLRKDTEEIENLEFVGEVSPDAVHDYYRNAKLLVNTSDYEGFPNTFLEAWRYETPVVSLFFDLDGILASNEVGTFSGSMTQLEHDIRQLGQDAELRRQMGATSREMIRQNYSLTAVTDDYEQIFNRVA
jgi:glycosyltransferase involved in cell wall biosynthesis